MEVKARRHGLGLDEAQDKNNGHDPGMEYAACRDARPGLNMGVVSYHDERCDNTILLDKAGM